MLQPFGHVAHAMKLFLFSSGISKVLDDSRACLGIGWPLHANHGHGVYKHGHDRELEMWTELRCKGNGARGTAERTEKQRRKGDRQACQKA